MSDSNYYQNQDPKYMEIGYNMTAIDRVQPGKIPFNIPVLTPQMNNSTMQDTKIIQRDKSNIQNESSGLVDVSDLEVSNYIYIEVPRELVAQPSGEYYIKGWVDFDGWQNYDSTINDIYIHGIDSDLAGVSAGSGYDRGGYQTFDGHENIDGVVELVPTESYRYIPAGSKWAIGFIGGDVNMPFIVCKLPDD